MEKTIGIIGFGNMGSVIAERIKSKYKVWVYDTDKNKTKNISGIRLAESLIDLVDRVDVIILAIKPQDFTAVANDILEHRSKDIRKKLIVSIAAGITTKFIEVIFKKSSVVRVMPNLPAKIGEGAICLCRGRFADSKDLNFVKNLFSNLGDIQVFDEKRMDGVTGVSGSGPGYIYNLSRGKTIDETKEMIPYFVSSLTVSAEKVGFSPKAAKKIATTTVLGSVKYLEKEKISPEEAEKQVVSKKGTTEAALNVFLEGESAWRKKKRKSKVAWLPSQALWIRAIRAAVRRAKELSRG